MRSPTDNGFTLLELLVVVTILAFATAFVGVNLGHRDSGSLDSVARTLVTDLRYARSRSQVANVDTDITFDVTAGAYVSRQASIERSLPDSIRLTLTVDRRDIDGSRGRIVFYPDGSSSGGKVSLRQGNRVMDVTTTWLNGYVRMEPAR